MRITIPEIDTASTAAASILCLFLTACATTEAPTGSKAEIAQEREIQHEYALDNLLEYQRRLDRIAQPVMIGSVSLCDDVLTGAIGAQVVNQSNYAKYYRDALIKRNIGAALSTLWVVEDSPAQRAVLQAGDELVSINSVDLGLAAK